MRPARVTGAAERMDAPDLPDHALRASLDHIAAVNRWLGGRRALFRHLAAIWPTGNEPVRILDVGTGSGDLPRAIVAWSRRTRRPVSVVACDVHPQTLGVARECCRSVPEITVLGGDALALDFPDGAFDIALLSMTLHHLEGEAQIVALRELFRVTRGAALVGELERSWPNYVGARVLAATVWRANEITRHDGPLSVLRAFSPGELRALALAAGLPEPKVYRHPFYRLVLRVDRPRAAARAEAP